MVTVEVLAILAIWMAIHQLRSKHARQRQLRERIGKRLAKRLGCNN